MRTDESLELLVFRLGPERFAVPLAAVDEVIDGPDVRRLPGAVGGSATQVAVASIGDALVSVIDPRELLGIRGSVGDAGTALLFTRNGRRIALRVDEVDDTFVLQHDDLLSAPVVASDRMLVGLVWRDASLIAVLDAAALFDAATAAAGSMGELAV